MTEIDLETGKTEAAPERKRRARTSVEGRKSSPRQPGKSKLEVELESRLERTFDRIAEARQARDDFELAEAIREDKAAMTMGIIVLTRNVAPLRNPLVMLLNLIEPVLAFWRVGRILGTRLILLRQRRAEEQAQALAEWEAAQQAGMPGVPSQGLS